MNSRYQRYGASLLITMLTLLLAACTGNGGVSVGYQPDFLPIKISASASDISIEGEASIVTPIGIFSIGAHYTLQQLSNGSIYVIIRNRETGFDHIYEVQSGTDELTAVVNGTTEVSVVDNEVTIDVIAGQIETIQFQKNSGAIPQSSSSRPWPAWRWYVVTIGIIGLIAIGVMYFSKDLSGSD